MLLELILLRCVDGQEQIFFDVSHCLLNSSTAVSMSLSVSIRPHRVVGPESQGHLRGHILAHLNVFPLAVLCFVLHVFFFETHPWVLEKDFVVPNLYTQKMKSPWKAHSDSACSVFVQKCCASSASSADVSLWNSQSETRHHQSPGHVHTKRFAPAQMHRNLRVTQWNLWVLQLVGLFCHVMAGKPSTCVEALEQAKNIVMEYDCQLC